MPNTLQGVLLFGIFSCVGAPVAPPFCPLEEELPPPPPPFPGKELRGWFACYFKMLCKSILQSQTKIMKTWIPMTKIIPARFANKWGMLWIWLKEKKMVLKSFENWARGKKNLLSLPLLGVTWFLSSLPTQIQLIPISSDFSSPKN